MGAATLCRLIINEEKHDRLLRNLERLESDLYPYA
jgi:hypothetical protein